MLLSTRRQQYTILVPLVCLTLLLTVLSLAQPTVYASSRQPLATSSSDWSMYGYNAQHTNFNPSETLINATNVSKLVPKWTISTYSYVQATPVLSNGVVYVSSAPYLTAYNINSGVQLWSVKVGFMAFYATPLVANGMVYIASLGTFTAYSASTGAVLWTDKLRIANSYAEPTMANGLIYESWDSGVLEAFNPINGAIVWSTSTGTVLYNSPAVANGLVYIGVAYSIVAYNAFTGKKVWSFLAQEYITSAVTTADGVVYFGVNGGGDRSIYALNALNGKKIWNVLSGGVHGLSISFAVANGVLYSYQGDVAAFNLKTGKHLWTASIGIGVTPSPGVAVANGVVYAGSYDGNWHSKLYALNASTGAQLWSYNVGQLETYVPIVVDSTVYVGSDRATLVAFHLPGH